MHQEGKGTGIAWSGCPEIKGTDGQEELGGVQAEREVQRSSPPHSAHFSLALSKLPAGWQRPNPHSTLAGEWFTVAPPGGQRPCGGKPMRVALLPSSPWRTRGASSVREPYGLPLSPMCHRRSPWTFGAWRGTPPSRSVHPRVLLSPAGTPVLVRLCA